MLKPESQPPRPHPNRLCGRWSIALLEYCFQVPANRIGAARFSPVQLKVIQEIITLVVFGVFVTYYFGQHLRWNHAAAGVCLVAAAFFVFHSW
ncbi:MAG: DMT family protein [Terracidiphilus sp.]